ncbi:DUF6901 family protein [Pseudomonas sp. LRF_L74]|uniref:DUF6901 family protein n=1 Tax=Pseudomonas sp. LRF_L74 TaxID=3369422 RepID=UPI003F60F930
MAIEYRIALDDHHQFSYRVELEREYDPAQVGDGLPKWTRLDYNQCSNCPLAKDRYSHCPAAVDLHRVVEDFHGLPAFHKAQVWVRTPEREYSKQQVGLEEALRSLLGVIMATSACPDLAQMKPMARNHLPFASSHEFVLRTISLYLTRQYFLLREGGTPDWELKGLVDQFKRLQLVNQAFWQRIHAICEGDSNLKAFLAFFSLSSSMTVSLETQLQKIRPMVMNTGAVS